MIPEDRALLADMARLNRDVAPLAMRIMDHSATSEEHHAFAERFEAMARRLRARGAQLGLVIDGDGVVANSAAADLTQEGSAEAEWSGVAVGAGSAGVTLRT